MRELRERLTSVLDTVRRGRSVVVTHRGRPVVRIEPLHAEAPPETRQLLERGVATWGGGRLAPIEPEELVGAGPTVSEILLAQRGAKVERRARSTQGQVSHTRSSRR